MARPATDYSTYVNEPDNTDLAHIPGSFGLPLIGDTIPFIKDPLAWAQQQYKRHGPVIKLATFGMKGVVVLGPELCKQVMLDPGQDFSSRMGFLERGGRFFGDKSLIMEDFEHHRHQRRIMQTAFKANSLRHYTTEINGIYVRALNEWEANGTQTVSFFKHIKQLLLEVAAEIFIGESGRGERMDKLNQAFIDCANGTLYLLPYAIPGTALYKGLKGREYLLEFFSNILAAKRAGDGQDMLSHFCRELDEDGKPYSDEEVMDQIIFLMFAAHDTTTAALVHTIYYLARHPEIKEKLYQECKSLGKGQLGYDDLDSVPEMQKVFFEVQRLRPSAPVIPRRTIREVEMAGHKIPAHTMVFTIAPFNHFMEEYWTEPDKFDPERFSPERAEQKQHPFLYHPFGGGAHKCIGMHFSQMEYKCFLHQFLLKYDFEARHKKDPIMLTVPIPTLTDGMPISLKLR